MRYMFCFCSVTFPVATVIFSFSDSKNGAWDKVTFGTSNDKNRRIEALQNICAGIPSYQQVQSVNPTFQGCLSINNHS